ncbi:MULTISPECIES: CPBP family intramembrane glutamic endopeptidase [Virgibacillus]|uniref:CAAX amino terminal protease self-immunity n=1 Tax=Virgibacillus dokdonensis TaxID=302167 RepID=A0A2K9IZJ8_9BACI|nr:MULTISPECIES: type II CAAX endopeptidase family protein [Virgibacillus]AUJ25142.1 CAAX amino terminal protease self- immunity [Virgibacillus dokdonensis]NWO14874.1 CPBP family intramembrane metalloprotease [Virgibacillus sp.]
MPKRYWWVIISYIITQFSVILTGSIVYTAFPVSKLEASIYGGVISFLLGLIVVLLLMRPDLKQGLQQRDGASIWGIITWSILGTFMAIFSQGIANFIQIMLLGIEPGSENTQGIMAMARAVPLFVIIPVLTAPILEEIIFRKIIFGNLYKRTNFFIAALISAALFAIIHGEPQHILVYGTMGLVFAYLYVETKRIIVPIFAHMAMNGLVVIAQYNLDPAEIEKQLNELQTVLLS